MRPDPTFCLAAVVAAAVLVSCASPAGLEGQYTRGIKAARADDWKSALPELEAYTAKSCHAARPSGHCREAFVALGRGYERRGDSARAWVAFDTALALPPHARDAAVREDL